MPSGKGAKERRRLSRLPLQQKWAESSSEIPGSTEQSATAEPETQGEADAGAPPPGGAAGLASAGSTGNDAAPKALGAAARLARQWGQDNHLAHAGEPAEDAASPLQGSPGIPADESQGAAHMPAAAADAAGGHAALPAQKATPTTSFSRRKGPEERAREAEAKRAAESAADGAGAGAAHDGAAAAQPQQQQRSAVPKLNLNVLSLDETKEPAAGASRSAADSAGTEMTQLPDASLRTDGQNANVLPQEAGEAATRHAVGVPASPRSAAPKTQSVAQVWALAGLQYARARMHACRADRHAAYPLGMHACHEHRHATCFFPSLLCCKSDAYLRHLPAAVAGGAGSCRNGSRCVGVTTLTASVVVIVAIATRSGQVCVCRNVLTVVVMSRLTRRESPSTRHKVLVAAAWRLAQEAEAERKLEEEAEMRRRAEEDLAAQKSKDAAAAAAAAAAAKEASKVESNETEAPMGVSGGEKTDSKPLGEKTRPKESQVQQERHKEGKRSEKAHDEGPSTDKILDLESPTSPLPPPSHMFTFDSMPQNASSPRSRDVAKQFDMLEVSAKASCVENSSGFAGWHATQSAVNRLFGNTRLIYTDKGLTCAIISPRDASTRQTCRLVASNHNECRPHHVPPCRNHYIHQRKIVPKAQPRQVRQQNCHQMLTIIPDRCHRIIQHANQLDRRKLREAQKWMHRQRNRDPKQQTLRLQMQRPCQPSPTNKKPLTKCRGACTWA